MLSAADIERWMSLYAATGLVCMIAFALSVIRVTVEVKAEGVLASTQGWKAWLLLGPKLWWRWQKVYLTTTPITLMIIGAFAANMDWSN